MNQPLVESRESGTSPDEAFTKMAERIKHNADQPFGGAVVIYPPAGGGDPVEFLLLDGSADVVQFWATAKKRIENAVEDLDQKNRNPQGFGMARQR